MKLLSGERLEDLQLDGLKIIQHKDKYTFTSDAAILANFVNAGPKDNVLEIGAGSGVISILLQYKCKPKKIVAFEIQPYMADMAQRSALLNNMEDKIDIINAPIQDFSKYVQHESFDVVVSNPPYQKIHNIDFLSKNEEEAISKHELKLTLKELISCTKNLLKYGGKFYIVYDAKRTAELIYELKANNLEPKKMFFVSPSENKNPNVVLIEAVKGGKPDITILPTLIANDKDGKYIYTIQKLYRSDI